MKHEYIDQNQIVDRYLMDKLRLDEVEEFEQHYLHCVRCQNELALSEKLRRGLEQATSSAVPETTMPLKPGLWQRYAQFAAQPAFAAAATVMIVGAVTANVVSLRMLADARDERTDLATRLARSFSPQSNNPIVLLSPVRSSRPSDGTPVHRLTLDDDPAWVVLAMELPDVSFPRYRAALRDAHAKTLWLADDLLLNNNDEIVVVVHSSQLTIGDYSVQVEGLKSDDSWATVSNYAFRVPSP